MRGPSPKPSHYRNLYHAQAPTKATENHIYAYVIVSSMLPPAAIPAEIGVAEAGVRLQSYARVSRAQQKI